MIWKTNLKFPILRCLGAWPFSLYLCQFSVYTVDNPITKFALCFTCGHFSPNIHSTCTLLIDSPLANRLQLATPLAWRCWENKLGERPVRNMKGDLQHLAENSESWVECMEWDPGWKQGITDSKWHDCLTPMTIYSIGKERQDWALLRTGHPVTRI